MLNIQTNRVVFLSLGLSGFSAFVYEVVWFRALSLVLGSTTYALSTMLSTFMAGLAIGAYFGGISADKAKRPVLLFAYIEGGLSLLSLLVLPAINLVPPLYARLYYTFNFSFTAFSFSQFLVCFIIMLLPTILMGATFPVACRICFTGGMVGRETGSLYAVNTLGAVAGSVMTGFVLIPSLGLNASNIIGASLNLIVALMLAYASGREGSRDTAVPAAIVISFLLTVFFVSMVPAGDAYQFNYYQGRRFSSYQGFERQFEFSEKIFERDDESGNVKVIKGAVDGERLLVNNGKVESNNKEDLLNLAVLAYLPAAANPGARSFLNIGLGTGGTVFYASTIPGIKEIYSVEISRSVTEASELYFYPGIFRDPRIRFITADARNYLSVVDRKYDVISSEPSYPVDQGFSHLYSKEFFELVKGRLNEGGIFCQWVPRYIFRGEEFRMIAKTFQTVFPQVTIWRAKGGDFILLGRRGAGFDTEDITESTVRWLKGNGLQAGDFALVSDQEEVEKRLSDYKGRLNTDDHPIVEFIGARRMFERGG